MKRTGDEKRCEENEKTNVLKFVMDEFERIY